VSFHSFLTSALDKCYWLSSLPGIQSLFPLNDRLGGYQSLSGRFGQKQISNPGHPAHCVFAMPTTATIFMFVDRKYRVGRDSSVGIATCYGLDGPEFESRWGRDFPHRSRPFLGPTKPPIQYVPAFSRG
jgi:hypothetical protein